MPTELEDETLPPKKRKRATLLSPLFLSELSLVDFPANVGSKITIFKRHDDKKESQKMEQEQQLEELEGAITDIGARIDQLSNAVAKATPPVPTLKKSFSETLEQVEKSGLSGCAALREARRINAEGFDAVRAAPLLKSSGDDFDKLVALEIQKGCPPTVAGQRVIHRLGVAPVAAKTEDKSSKDFDAIVDEIAVEKKLTRSAAMSEARRRHPDKYAAYQQV